MFWISRLFEMELQKTYNRWTVVSQALLCINAENEVQRELKMLTRNNKVNAKFSAWLNELNQQVDRLAQCSAWTLAGFLRDCDYKRFCHFHTRRGDGRHDV